MLSEKSCQFHNPDDARNQGRAFGLGQTRPAKSRCAQRAVRLVRRPQSRKPRVCQPVLFAAHVVVVQGQEITRDLTDLIVNVTNLVDRGHFSCGSDNEYFLHIGDFL